ncbi:phosphoketolase family protein [Sesbania bispinosa]|nr:phosphoketolase family protein [Sesbania bispinosa]
MKLKYVLCLRRKTLFLRVIIFLHPKQHSRDVCISSLDRPENAFVRVQPLSASGTRVAPTLEQLGNASDAHGTRKPSVPLDLQRSFKEPLASHDEDNCPAPAAHESPKGPLPARSARQSLEHSQPLDSTLFPAKPSALFQTNTIHVPFLHNPPPFDLQEKGSQPSTGNTILVNNHQQQDLVDKVPKWIAW